MASEPIPFRHVPRHGDSAIPAGLVSARGACRTVVAHAVTIKRLGVDVEGAVAALASAGRPAIGYDAYCAVLATLPVECRAMLTATVFASLPRNAEGEVPVAALVRYLRGRVALRALYARLLAYDSDHDGALSETDFENYVYDSIPHIADLASLEEPFFPFYVFAAVRKVFFFLDKNHTGKIPIPAVVTSGVMAEWLQLNDSPPTSSAEPGSSSTMQGFGAVPPANWFSASNARRVYRQYLELDADQNGMLSVAELRNFNNGSLTASFCARVFEECRTWGGGAGELDFKAFLEFVLAVEYRATPQSLRFMFRLFDVSKRGLLVRADLRYFMRAVLDKLASEGNDRLELESCVDEVWDMVKPAAPEGITLRDLERCKVGHIVTLILADSAGFLAYDTRESQQQAPLFADVTGDDSGSS